MKDKLLPQEFGAHGAELEDSAGESLAFHEGRRVAQLVPLKVAARDSQRLGSFPGGHDDADAAVAAAAHGAAPRVHQETHQEAAKSDKTI